MEGVRKRLKAAQPAHAPSGGNGQPLPRLCPRKRGTGCYLGFASGNPAHESSAAPFDRRPGGSSLGMVVYGLRKGKGVWFFPSLAKSFVSVHAHASPHQKERASVRREKKEAQLEKKIARSHLSLITHTKMTAGRNEAPASAAGSFFQKNCRKAAASEKEVPHNEKANRQTVSS